MTTVNYGWQEGADHDTMHLRIAGWIVELRVSPRSLARPMAARYEAFRVPAGVPDLHVEVENRPAEAAGASVNSLGVLQARLTAKGDKYLLDSPDHYGMIDLSQGRAAFRLRSPDPSPVVEYFLRIALALFALSRDGLLIHCAALKRENLVYLFIGQSGSGKSTVVALSRAAGRAAALGDDLIVLRSEGEGWQAYGTPFWNFQTTSHDGQHETGRVARIYKLIQDRTVFVEPMGRAAGTAELVANCPVVNGHVDLLPAVLERCGAIAGALGVERLHFLKDASFWDVAI